ncbi:MAG: hypothetical protein IH936_00140 [Acidobacteria bacterium]|nr:hypothetical protein [Acidobacteriota bacterium]
MFQAPARAQDAADRVLRNVGFVEILPYVYRSRWMEPDLPKLKRALRRARRRGVGQIAIARLDRKGLTML